MSKSADAFRTISEVAEWLGVQTHVLRFWESKFNQVRPVKRAGGRRYYRPNDMLLLGGIRQLLHVDGLTVKGVQKVLREEGVAYVAAKSRPLDELTTAEIDGEDETLAPDAAPAAAAMPAPEATPEPAPEAAQDTGNNAPDLEPAPSEEASAQPSLPLGDEAPAPDLAAPAPDLAAPAEDRAEPAAETQAEGLSTEDTPVAPEMPSDTAPAVEPEPEPLPADTIEPAPVDVAADAVTDTGTGTETGTEMGTEEAGAETATDASRASPEAEAVPSEPDEAADGGMAPPDLEDFAAAEPDAPAPDAAPETSGPTPNIVDAPDPPAPEDMPAVAGALSRLASRNALSAEEKAAIAPLLKDLAALRDKMAAAGRSTG